MESRYQPPAPGHHRRSGTTTSSPVPDGVRPGDLTGQVSTGLAGAEWRGVDPTSKGRIGNSQDLSRKKLWRAGIAGSIRRSRRSGSPSLAKAQGWDPMLKRYLEHRRRACPRRDRWHLPLNNVAANAWAIPSTETQKTLLDRIIGQQQRGRCHLGSLLRCGTAVAVAALGRQWKGIDVTHRR